MDDFLKQAAERGLIASTQGVNMEALIPPVVTPDPRTHRNDGKPRLRGGLVPTLNEAQFQEQVIQLAHIQGWRVAHFRKVRVQRKDGSVYFETPVAADGKGFLDLELVRERIIKVELKVGTNTLTPEQEDWLLAYQKAGVEWYVWMPKDWPEIKRVLDSKKESA